MVYTIFRVEQCPKGSFFWPAGRQVGEIMAETLALYNPNIHNGDFVVSQFLEDESLPFDNSHTGVYQLTIEGSEIALYNVYGIKELSLEFDDLIKTGEFGEERFTVVQFPDTLAPVTPEDVIRHAQHLRVLVDKPRVA